MSYPISPRLGSLIAVIADTSSAYSTWSDALRIAGVLITVIGIPYGFYRLCLKLASWAAQSPTSGRRIEWLGYALVVFGFIEQSLAVALFTWRGSPPLWLEVLGGIGFWGWWTLVAAGAACISAGRRRHTHQHDSTGAAH